MSDPTQRAVALTNAVALVAGKNSSPEAVIALADKFDAWMSGGSKPAAAPAQPAKPAATKPSTTKKPPAKTEEQIAQEALDAANAEAEGEEGTEDAGEEGPSKEDVAAAIDRFIKGGKRAEIVTLLKKFKATSASSVPEADRAKFIAQADKLFPPSDELTD